MRLEESLIVSCYDFGVVRVVRGRNTDVLVYVVLCLFVQKH